MTGAISSANHGIHSDAFFDGRSIDWGTGAVGPGSLVSGTVLVMPWVGYVMPPPPAPAPAHPVASTLQCYDVVFVGARGSGEAPKGSAPYSSDESGLGDRTLSAYWGVRDYLAEVRPDWTIKRRGVRYAALDVPLSILPSTIGNYFDSIHEGADRTISLMEDELSRCEDTYFILSGYSQGAISVHFALLDMSSTLRSRVGGVILIANGAKVGNDIEELWEAQGVYAGNGVREAYGVYHGWWPVARIPSDVRSRTVEICHNYDPVCAPGFTFFMDITAHTNYSYNELYALGRLGAVYSVGYLNSRI